MDIRDIIETPKPPQGQTIEAIFDLQNELLIAYTKIEKLPEYPFNINSPDKQVIIKDFIARIVEELGEAYESFLGLWEDFSSGTLTQKGALSYLYNFNEELADALHFLVETFIVCGITKGDLRNMVAKAESPNNNPDLYTLLSGGQEITSFANPVLTKLLGPYNDPIIQGGQPWLDTNGVARHFWEVTFRLQIARNTLKNKPWKQTQMLSDLQMFSSHMSIAFMAFIKATRFVGISEENLFALYYRKNQINQFRIKSRY